MLSKEFTLTCPASRAMYEHIQFLAKKTGTCTASDNYLKEFMQTSLSTIKRYIRKLKKAALIIIIRKKRRYKQEDGTFKWSNSRQIMCSQKVLAFENPFEKEEKKCEKNQKNGVTFEDNADDPSIDIKYKKDIAIIDGNLSDFKKTENIESSSFPFNGNSCSSTLSSSIPPVPVAPLPSKKSNSKHFFKNNDKNKNKNMNIFKENNIAGIREYLKTPEKIRVFDYAMSVNFHGNKLVPSTVSAWINKYGASVVNYGILSSIHWLTKKKIRPDSFSGFICNEMNKCTQDKTSIGINKLYAIGKLLESGDNFTLMRVLVKCVDFGFTDLGYDLPSELFRNRLDSTVISLFGGENKEELSIGDMMMHLDIALRSQNSMIA